MPTSTQKAIWRSSNPTLNTKTFHETSQQYAGVEPMTVGGAINKTAFLLLLLIVAAAYVWMPFIGVQEPTGLMPYLLVGAIGGLVVALIVVFKPTTAPYLSPVYALLEGVVIGAISSLLETRFPGIVLQAVGLTFGTLIVMLAAYRSGLIKATEKFKMGVVAATGAILLVYVASFILGLFGIAIPFINSSGPFGIIFSLNGVLGMSFFQIADSGFAGGRWAAGDTVGAIVLPAASGGVWVRFTERSNTRSEDPLMVEVETLIDLLWSEVIVPIEARH